MEKISCSWRRLCVASVKHQILPSGKLMSNFHRTKAKEKNVCIMTLLQQLLSSNNTAGSRLPLVIVMNFKSLPLLFIPDHRRGSLDVWFKDEPTFAGGREPQDFSPVGPAASATLCTVLPDTPLNCSPVQDEQRHGGGVWDARHQQRSNAEAHAETKGKRSLKVILLCRDVSDVWDQPLCAVESQDGEEACIFNGKVTPDLHFVAVSQ